MQHVQIRDDLRENLRPMSSKNSLRCKNAILSSSVFLSWKSEVNAEVTVVAEEEVEEVEEEEEEDEEDEEEEEEEEEDFLDLLLAVEFFDRLLLLPPTCTDAGTTIPTNHSLHNTCRAVGLFFGSADNI